MTRMSKRLLLYSTDHMYFTIDERANGDTYSTAEIVTGKKMVIGQDDDEKTGE